MKKNLDFNTFLAEDSTRLGSPMKMLLSNTIL